MTLGWLFKTPGDDATEVTLRKLHTQNTLDEYYYRGYSWVRTVLLVGIGVLATSFFEGQADISIWDATVIYCKNKVWGWVGL